MVVPRFLWRIFKVVQSYFQPWGPPVLDHLCPPSTHGPTDPLDSRVMCQLCTHTHKHTLQSSQCSYFLWHINKLKDDPCNNDWTEYHTVVLVWSYNRNTITLDLLQRGLTMVTLSVKVLVGYNESWFATCYWLGFRLSVPQFFLVSFRDFYVYSFFDLLCWNSLLCFFKFPFLALWECHATLL